MTFRRKLIAFASLLSFVLPGGFASAENEVIYRYKDQLVYTNSGSGSKGTGSTGSTGSSGSSSSGSGGSSGTTTPPAETIPASCSSPDPDDVLSCSQGYQAPSTTGQTPISVTFTDTPPGGGSQYGYRCFSITGGYGDYRISGYVTSDGSSVSSIDILPVDNLNAAPAGSPYAAIWPHNDGSGFTQVSAVKDLCLRFTPNKSYAGTDYVIQMSMAISDYASSGVSSGHVTGSDTDYVSSDSSDYFSINYDMSTLFGVVHNTGALQDVNFEGEDTYTGQYLGYNPGAMSIKQTVTGKTAAGLYYACYEASSTGALNEITWTASNSGNRMPGWISWLDIVPPAGLTLPQQVPNGSSNSSDVGAFPTGDSRTTNNEACVRVSPVATSKSNEATQINLDVTSYFYDEYYETYGIENFDYLSEVTNIIPLRASE